MSLKANTNKIHADLLNNFDEVSISEKSSLKLGEYIELKATNENKELVIIVEKRQIELGKFTWGYWANPISQDYLVERTSTVDGLIDDVKDIFNKNRFSEDYLTQINK